MTELKVTPRILMVDDEPNVLSGYKRALRSDFTVVGAGSGAEGLALVQRAITNRAPFPVVVSDMMMPGMNGAEFLGRVREIDPDAVQLLLSGQADLESTIAAVNDGNLFRFLTKPCEGDDLATALNAAVEQHRLVGAERALLERTLTGAVDVLTELLAMASPEAFTRTERVRAMVDKSAKMLKVNDWRLPLAAMLSQIGCVAVPPDVLHRARAGGELTDEERAVYLAHPQTARRLLSRIPRLEEVAEWVGNQPVDAADAAGADATTGATGADRTAGADPVPVTDPSEQLLRAVLEYLVILDETGQPGEALARLRAGGQYPARTVEALARAASGVRPDGVIRELPVEKVLPGMILDADVETVTGMVLVRKGERVTMAVAMRLANFALTVGVKEPVVVLDGL
jgi:CheY-like chemotaxis protein